MSEDDEEAPQLSTHALEALKDFYNDKDTRQKHFEELRSKAEDEADDRQWSMEDFSEDWQTSQFWYTDETASTLAKELLRDSDAKTCIAVVAAPSVFVQLKSILSSTDRAERPEIRLLEFDDRFAVFNKEFVHYDFAHPLRLPVELKGHFDRIVIDPPFLSDDCQTKAALTARWLSKSWTPPSDPASPQPFEQRLILCTGERMESLALRLYKGFKTTTFLPQHSKGLSNEFRCYANYTCEAWQWSS